MKTKGIPIKGGVVKDFVKDYRALKLKTKGIPVKGESIALSLGCMWYKKSVSWRDEILT